MKIDKPDLLSFIGQAEQIMIDNGFQRTVVDDHTSYEWKKSTPLGVLLVDVSSDFPTSNYCIYTRFKGQPGRMSFRAAFPHAVLDEVEVFIKSNMFKGGSK